MVVTPFRVIKKRMQLRDVRDSMPPFRAHSKLSAERLRPSSRMLRFFACGAAVLLAITTCSRAAAEANTAPTMRSFQITRLTGPRPAIDAYPDNTLQAKLCYYFSIRTQTHFTHE
jgi:hypothetical protein